jgi:PKD repeat protein
VQFNTFKFSTDFTSITAGISDKKVVWNFGDGTTSAELTATHWYKYPGTYLVQLNLFDQFGQGTQNSYVSSIAIYNYIPDTIIISSTVQPILTSGEAVTQLFLTRYNSWQMSSSAENTVINLTVSGNQSPFYSASAYNSDKFAHLKSSSRFALSSTFGLTVVDQVSTTNNPIFLLVNGTNYLVGTSGVSSFYYIEDSKI